MDYFNPPSGLNQNIQSLSALILLIILFPIFIFIGLLIKISSDGPIIFKQKRVGLHGKIFTLYKFRTMKQYNHGSKITEVKDKRITKIGHYLRIFKLDEIPQLWNIFNKTMSFVGPRPEVEKYVDLNYKIWNNVLSVRPGLTDPVMFELRNEQDLLAEISEDKELFYTNHLLPHKLKIQFDYIKKRSWLSDIKIIFLTIFLTIFPWFTKTPTINKIKQEGVFY